MWRNYISDIDFFVTYVVGFDKIDIKFRKFNIWGKVPEGKYFWRT